jgi:hypothetical protein
MEEDDDDDDDDDILLLGCIAESGLLCLRTVRE